MNRLAWGRRPGRFHIGSGVSRLRNHDDLCGHRGRVSGTYEFVDARLIGFELEIESSSSAHLNVIDDLAAVGRLDPHIVRVPVEDERVEVNAVPLEGNHVARGPHVGRYSPILGLCVVESGGVVPVAGREGFGVNLRDGQVVRVSRPLDLEACDLYQALRWRYGKPVTIVVVAASADCCQGRECEERK